MATVIWSKRAKTERRKLIVYGYEEFGQMTAIKFVNKLYDITNILEKHPLIGFIEPSLKGHKGHTYRAYPVIGHIKLIYYYSSSTKTVRIADIWDTRRKPEALTNRIK